MFKFPEKNIQILKDDRLQNDLNQKGYCILPLLTIEQIELFTNLYKEHHQINSSGFFPSTYSNNKEYRKKVSEQLILHSSKIMSQNFIDYKVFTGNFIIKHQGKNTELGLHQDMTLVDETKYMGINVWCPLCDITSKNGAIWFLEGSNRLFPTYRGPTIPNIYDLFPNEIKSCMKPIYLRAGEAIVFDHSILHFSPPNLSKEDRIAFNIFISNSEAEIIEAYYNKEKKPAKIDIYQQQSDFFTEYEQFDTGQFDRPKIGKISRTEDYDFPVLGIDFLKIKYNYKPSRHSYFLNKYRKIKSLFE